MKRIGYPSLAIAVLAMGLFASIANAGDGRTCPGATPTPNGAFIFLNYWNDCPTSTDTAINNFPSQIEITDAHNDCFGFTDKHLWKFSADGGTTAAEFENCSMYEFCSDVTVTGDGVGEAGIQISPWWSIGDGQFMLNYGSGEIAVFGGRLPFYSFTAAYGLTYTKGQTVGMKMAYNPRNLDAAFPGEVKYILVVGGTIYDSGWLNFDMGNAAEDPPHGLYGATVPHTVGGYFQPNNGDGLDWTSTAKFSSICFNPVPTPAATTTWGQLKSIYR